MTHKEDVVTDLGTYCMDAQRTHPARCPIFAHLRPILSRLWRSTMTCYLTRWDQADPTEKTYKQYYHSSNLSPIDL